MDTFFSGGPIQLIGSPETPFVAELQ
ncbi:MAG: hypothetical protein ACJAYI_002323, partial [Myxococcota bacterium]